MSASKAITREEFEQKYKEAVAVAQPNPATIIRPISEGAIAKEAVGCPPTTLAPTTPGR